jgi:hypothetical protein
MDLRPQRWTILLGLVACLWGFVMGGVFGAAEDPIKEALRARGEAVLETHYAGDATKAQAVVDKSFRYLVRSHLHGGAIGAVATLCGLVLATLRRGPPGPRRAIGALIGAGALAYALYWAAAGWIAPGLGSTGAAKEALAWWAIPAAGACILGLTGTVVLAALEWWSAPPPSTTA